MPSKDDAKLQATTPPGATTPPTPPWSWEPISVDPPGPDEERRQLAEAVADINAVMQTIINEDNGELLPGESRDELRAAWPKSDQKFREVVKRLSSDDESKLSHENLQSHGLTGPEGKAKRNWLRRKIDDFRAFFHSQPRTDEKRKQSAESAIGLLEICGTLLGSIPIYGEVLKEIAELLRQGVMGRVKRGF